MQAAHESVAKLGQWPFQYGEGPGYDGLTALLVEKMVRDQGIICSPDNIVLTAGSSQAIEFVAEILLNPNDVVLIETPTFLGTARSLKTYDVQMEGVPLDDEGVDVNALETILQNVTAQDKRVKLFYTIPNFHNPAGVTTTLERRKRIVTLAKRYDFLILEDDAYYDIRFGDQPITPLYVLDDDARTIYFGTFSKILAPGMRIGWLVADVRLVNRITALHPIENAAPLSVHLAWEFCQDGGLDRNIQQLCQNYARRCEIMLDACDEFMPASVKWSKPTGGFFVWMTLPEWMDAGELLEQTNKRGVDFLPGKFCYHDASAKNKVRLAFSYAPENKIAEGIRIIAEEINAISQKKPNTTG
jgi:2-aminoadipate transaminase